MLSLCFSYALSAFSPFFFSFSKSYQQLSMKERNRLCKSSDRRTLFSLKIRFTTIKVLLQAALLWYFSKISFLLQKLLTLIPPWKDFSLQPRILNIRSNLEESYLCDLFLVWICGRLFFFSSTNIKFSVHITKIKIGIIFCYIAKGHSLTPVGMHPFSSRLSMIRGDWKQHKRGVCPPEVWTSGSGV